MEKLNSLRSGEYTKTDLLEWVGWNRRILAGRSCLLGFFSNFSLKPDQSVGILTMMAGRGSSQVGLEKGLSH